ncbi:hypothetical protein [Paenibacillus puerhi]|uniref:hypothetical protein n=1 Tax=Paenibacillus puerhi TaxID=2692622 RepID=UPI00135AA844|nr:hypothetical protein [Paenibacillus puerhi]
MEWFEDFHEEMIAVFTEAETMVARFPQPYNAMGQHYLDKFTVLKEASSKNYICYLLPFWLSDLTGLSPAFNRRLSLGSVFGMLYYFILDDLMDSPRPDCRDKLPLAHFFHYEFLTVFRELFPDAGSPLWLHYRDYDAQWAEAMSRETDHAYMQARPLTLAHKAAPVKLTASAALLLADRADLREVVNSCIDEVLVLLQLADDWSDWEEDLQEGSYNSLIALAADSPGEERGELSRERIRKLIYDRDLPQRYVHLARSRYQQAIPLLAELPYLQHFSRFLLDGLARDAAHIQEEQKKMESGGLFYYLSKNSQNY